MKKFFLAFLISSSAFAQEIVNDTIDTQVEASNVSIMLQNKIDELDLKDRVILTKKFIENIDEYIKLCDVFLFPTWNEALGTPILEAQACGVPVVANLMHGSTDYWIKDNKGGFVVEKFDDKLWAEKIKLALNISNETLRENSSKIIKIASAKNIDAEYFKRIEAIT